MPTLKELDEGTRDALLARLNEADQNGDREQVRDLRRYIAATYGVDAYREGRTMIWNIARPSRPPGEPTEEDNKEEDVGKREKESRFRNMFGGRGDDRDDEMEYERRQVRREIERREQAMNRPPAESMEEALQRAMVEAIRTGRLNVPDKDVREEARRRMDAFRNQGRRGQPDWSPPDEWKTKPSEPPPPELPPDVHMPTEEETMASINEFFKQETNT